MHNIITYIADSIKQIDFSYDLRIELNFLDFIFDIQLKQNVPVEEHFLRFLQRLFLPKSVEKMQTDVQQYALADIALRGIGSCLYRCKLRNFDYKLMYENRRIVM